MTPKPASEDGAWPDDLRALRGDIVHCLGRPTGADDVECIADGVLLTGNGRIVACGGVELLQTLPDATPLDDYTGCLLVPGFVDCHVHYPQLDVIASYGTQLLDWLERYTYPAEMRYADTAYAEAAAGFFVDQLLRNGTTSALVFSTSHVAATRCLFEAAHRRGLRLVTGRTLMDRHCPKALANDVERQYDDDAALIERWHGRDRLRYAVTPRFAPTSTERQLAVAGQIVSDFPGVMVQSHLAETRRELAWVAELFPGHRDYVDVYEANGLVTSRTVFAHGIHLSDSELSRLGGAQAAIAFCPSSNLFLGSGLFDLARTRTANVRVGLASDVGAGTRLGIPATAADGYKVLQLQHQSLAPFDALYLMTLAGAVALGVDDSSGNFVAGKEADIVVLDPAATALSRHRAALADGIEERLFATLMLADERMIRATYVLGKPVWPGEAVVQTFPAAL